MIFSKQNADRYIVFAVTIQCLLALIQIIMLESFGMKSEIATGYRVIFTAVPLSAAIVISFKRRPVLFVSVYIIAAVVLMANLVIFPENASYLSSDALRFLLPVTIPSALCLMTISDDKTFEDVLYAISWVAFALVLYYAYCLFTGRIVFESYNMGFSYTILLPTVSLYSRKKFYSVVAAVMMLALSVAIGSRGAALVFLIYVAYDLYSTNKKVFLLYVIVLAIVVANAIIINNILLDNGISSRTLNHLVEGELLDDTHRGLQQKQVINAFLRQPIMGLGLWGDRSVIGVYSHNLIIEILACWGVVLGAVILIYSCVKCLRIYRKANRAGKSVVIKYFIVLVMPLMVSGSYLTSYMLPMYVAILYLLNREAKIKAPESYMRSLKSFKTIKSQ